MRSCEPNQEPSTVPGEAHFCALTHSAGARRYYDQLRAKGLEHDGALRALANRLVGILHHCLNKRVTYQEAIAWPAAEATAA